MYSIGRYLSYVPEVYDVGGRDEEDNDHEEECDHQRQFLLVRRLADVGNLEKKKRTKINSQTFNVGP